MTHPPLTPLSFHILLSLVREPAHGYGVLKEIEERTGGGDVPSTGALYLALQRLEREGLIEAADAPSDADGRRRYWTLTGAGRRAARAEAERMEALLADEAVSLLRGGAGGRGG